MSSSLGDGCDFMVVCCVLFFASLYYVHECERSLVTTLMKISMNEELYVVNHSCCMIVIIYIVIVIVDRVLLSDTLTWIS